MQRLDECYGFPDQLTAKQARRLRIRTFAARNQWRAQYPSLERVAADLKAGTSTVADLVLTHGLLRSQRADVWWNLAAVAVDSETLTETYSALASKACDVPAAVARQIELDLPRTFCEQHDFRVSPADLSARDGSRFVSVPASATVVGSGSAQDALRRMLHAFALRHPACGYLQSLNYVAGFALLVVGREYEARAYAVFDAVAAHFLSGYYAGDMAVLKLDCAVFSALLGERLPQLSAHLSTHGLSDMPALFLPRWLLCIFLNCFPIWITARVWDAMLMEGCEAPRFLLEVCLAVFRIVMPDLLSVTSFGDVAEVLKSVGSRVGDAAELLLLTRTEECSLHARPMADWRASHGGAEFARFSESETGNAMLAAQAAAAAASASAPGAAASSLPDSTPTLVPCNTASSNAAPPLESMSEVSDAGRSSGAFDAVRGTKKPEVVTRKRGREGTPSPHAGESPLQLVLEQRAAGGAPPAGDVTLTPKSGAAATTTTLHGAAVCPPVDLDESLDRVFSPLASSPLAQRMISAGAGAAASSASSPALAAVIGPAASSAAVAQRMLLRKRTFRNVPIGSCGSGVDPAVPASAHSPQDFDGCAEATVRSIVTGVNESCMATIQSPVATSSYAALKLQRAVLASSPVAPLLGGAAAASPVDAMRLGGDSPAHVSLATGRTPGPGSGLLSNRSGNQRDIEQSVAAKLSPGLPVLRSSRRPLSLADTQGGVTSPAMAAAGAKPALKASILSPMQHRTFNLLSPTRTILQQQQQLQSQSQSRVMHLKASSTCDAQSQAVVGYRMRGAVDATACATGTPPPASSTRARELAVSVGGDGLENVSSTLPVMLPSSPAATALRVRYNLNMNPANDAVCVQSTVPQSPAAAAAAAGSDVVAVAVKAANSIRRPWTQPPPDVGPCERIMASACADAAAAQRVAPARFATEYQDHDYSNASFHGRAERERAGAVMELTLMSPVKRVPATSRQR